MRCAGGGGVVTGECVSHSYPPQQDLWACSLCYEIRAPQVGGVSSWKEQLLPVCFLERRLRVSGTEPQRLRIEFLDKMHPVMETDRPEEAPSNSDRCHSAPEGDSGAIRLSPGQQEKILI